MPASIVIAGLYTQPGLNESPLVRAEDEYVVLVNVGNLPVDMRAWSLTNRKQDAVHHYRYLFPRFLSNGDPWVLEPGGMVFLYTGRGRNGGTATPGEAHQFHFYQHRPVHIWHDSGDMVCLYDRSDSLVSWWERPGVRRVV